MSNKLKLHNRNQGKYQEYTIEKPLASYSQGEILEHSWFGLVEVMSKDFKKKLISVVDKDGHIRKLITGF